MLRPFSEPLAKGQRILRSAYCGEAMMTKPTHMTVYSRIDPPLLAIHGW
jgi:hypothetical protein